MSGQYGPPLVMAVGHNISSKSCAYIRCASVSCFLLERQEAVLADSRAWAKTGKRIAARIAMIAMTTSSSMRVKPRLHGLANITVSFLCWRAITAWLDE